MSSPNTMRRSLACDMASKEVSIQHTSSFPENKTTGQAPVRRPPPPPPQPPSPPRPFDLGPTYSHRPFLSEQLLDDESPPPTAWKDFQTPLHRQFSGHNKDITWRSYLGHGLDGVVFKASIGDQVFAIKVVRIVFSNLILPS